MSSQVVDPPLRTDVSSVGISTQRPLAAVGGVLPQEQFTRPEAGDTIPKPDTSHTADEEAAPIDRSELRVEAMHIFEARLRPAYVPTTLEHIRTSACEQLATYLRDKPTLPGDQKTNCSEPWADYWILVFVSP